MSCKKIPQKISVQLFFLIGAIFLSSGVAGQTYLTGRILTETDSTPSPVEFANVLFYDVDDTTDLRKALITDMNGTFSFGNTYVKAFQVKVSCVGYKSKSFTLKIPENAGSQHEFQETLTPKVEALEEVEVVGNRVEQRFDKTIYTITKRQAKQSFNSADLVKEIPGLQYDLNKETIKTISGESVKILINGLNASQTELKALRSKDVVKIEHYDFPPARYAEAAAVVNYITKPREDGGNAGVNLNPALTTTCHDGYGYFKYNRKRSQVGISYSIRRRDYTNIVDKRNYKYQFAGQQVNREQRSLEEFAYTTQKLKVEINTLKDSSYAFQLKIKPGLHKKNSASDLSSSVIIGDTATRRTGFAKYDKYRFKPVVDLYLSKQLNQKNELAANVVATGFVYDKNTQEEEFFENGDTAYLENSSIESRKYSLIGEFYYSRKFSNHQLNLGIESMFSRMKQSVTNFLNPLDYKTRSSAQKAYIEGRGKLGVFNYQAVLSGDYYDFKETGQNNRYDYFTFAPEMMLGYQFNKRQSIKLYYKGSSFNPSLSQLSNNIILMNEHMVRQGNPELEPYYINNIGARYSYSGEKLSFVLLGMYINAPRYIQTYFVEEDNYIKKVSVNMNSTQSGGIKYGFFLNPFEKKWLQMKLYGSATYTSLKYADKHVTHASFPMNFKIVLNHGWIGLVYQGRLPLPHMELNGEYLKRPENRSNLFLRAGLASFRIEVGYQFIAVPAKYYSETIPESIVTYEKDRRIKDNKNMVKIRVKYNFDFGKRYKEQERKLNNKDNDSGVF